MDDYQIKKGYRANLQNNYYEDYSGTAIYQPDIYTAAVKLARRIRASRIIDIGSGNGEKLIPYKSEFKFTFIDYGPNLKIIENNIGKKNNKFIEQNLELGFPALPDRELVSSVVICSDVIEHIVKPDILIKSLVKISSRVPLMLISTPDRLSTRGVSDYGPPMNPAHVREWSLEELNSLFRSYGLQAFLIGLTRSNSYDQVRQTSVIVAGKLLADILNNQKSASINVDQSQVTDYTKTYYGEQLIGLSPVTDKLGISLQDGEYLVSPVRPLKLGPLIADAKLKRYKYVEAQVIYISPNNDFSWPQAGIDRQKHGLIGVLGEVRKFNLNKTIKTPSIYPFRLTILSSQKNFILRSQHYTKAARLVDTGHLHDDYLLETLVGWGILDR